MALQVCVEEQQAEESDIAGQRGNDAPHVLLQSFAPAKCARRAQHRDDLWLLESPCSFFGFFVSKDRQGAETSPTVDKTAQCLPPVCLSSETSLIPQTHRHCLPSPMARHG